MEGRLGTALAAALTLALCACGPADSDDTVPEDPVSSSPTSSDPAPQPRGVQEAVDDLAAALDVDASEITVASVEDVTWRDGSIGCAEPGKMYTQALVDGQRIVLSVADERYEYHSGGPRGSFHCKKPTE